MTSQQDKELREKIKRFCRTEQAVDNLMAVVTSWKDKEVRLARIDELQHTSDKLVKLGVPVANYDDPKGYSRVGHMFADRIKSLQSQGGKNE